MEPKYIAADREGAKSMDSKDANHPHAGHGCPADPEVLAGRAPLRAFQAIMGQDPNVAPAGGMGGFTEISPDKLKEMMAERDKQQKDYEWEQRKSFWLRLVANVVMNLAVQAASVALGLAVWSHWLR